MFIYFYFNNCEQVNQIIDNPILTPFQFLIGPFGLSFSILHLFCSAMFEICYIRSIPHNSYLIRSYIKTKQKYISRIILFRSIQTPRQAKKYVVGIFWDEKKGQRQHDQQPKEFDAKNS